MGDSDSQAHTLGLYLNEIGESLSTLALRINRSPSTLTRALSGQRNPSLRLARDVERGTGGRVTASEFMEICIRAGSGPATAGSKSA